MSVVGVSAKLLMQVPPEHRAALANGAFRLTGSILRNTKSGQIVGFLQEAAPVARVASPMALKSFGKFASVTASTGGNVGVGAAVAVTDLALQGANLVQGEKIRAGVGRLEDGLTRVEDKLGIMDRKLGTISQGVDLLQNLGVANLAMSAAGVGVSLVGFGIMAMKLERVQTSIHAISDQLDGISAKIDRLRQDAVDADFNEIQSMCVLYEEGWGFGDRGRAEQQWLRLSHDARTLQDRFAWRAKELLQSPQSGGLDLADQMLEAMTLASGLRVSALLACNEGALATSISNEAAVQLETLTGSVGLAELALPLISSDVEQGSPDYDMAFVVAREAARPMLQRVRHREASVATRTAPLDVLEQRGCAPREWLEEARAETDEPVLMISAAEM